jgi:hypothetical protein
MATANVQFGSGVLFMKPTAGNLATNPTPYRPGVLQEVSIDFKGDHKKLFGQKQFAVATARGKVEIDGKAKLAVFDAGFLSQLYFGQNATSGLTKIIDQEGPTAIPTTPFQLTVAQAATFVADYGVQFADGTQLTKVASAPAAGQYSVVETGGGKGVYTFASADNVSALTVKISYSYTVAGTGKTLLIANQLMGFAPEFEAFVYNAFRSNFLGIKLNDCTMLQVGIPTKQEDFWVMDITFAANADASDNIGALYIQ